MKIVHPCGLTAFLPDDFSKYLVIKCPACRGEFELDPKLAVQSSGKNQKACPECKALHDWEVGFCLECGYDYQNSRMAKIEIIRTVKRPFFLASKSNFFATLLVASFLLWAGTFFLQGRYPDYTEIAPSLRKEPVQTPTEEEDFTFNYLGKGYVVHPVAEYELWGFVTSRMDDGKGACEVIFVRELEFLSRGTPFAYLLHSIGFYGMILFLFLRIVSFFLEDRPVPADIQKTSG